MARAGNCKSWVLPVVPKELTRQIAVQITYYYFIVKRKASDADEDFKFYKQVSTRWFLTHIIKFTAPKIDEISAKFNEKFLNLLLLLNEQYYWIT